jgi:excisionase family DNA binding protein
MTRVFSSREVAEIIGADPSSVNRWIDSGQIKAYRTPGGHRRVLAGELLAFLERCGMPIPEQLRSSEQLHGSDQPPRSEQPRRVLIVDDDTALSKTVSRALQQLDPHLEVACCTSGIEALLRIGALKPDVVVLDVFMPGLDGIAVCEKIKADAALPAVRVIAVTGKPNERVTRRIREAGADALLTKPFRPAALLEAIRGADSSRAHAKS